MCIIGIAEADTPPRLKGVYRMNRKNWCELSKQGKSRRVNKYLVNAPQSNSLEMMRNAYYDTSVEDYLDDIYKYVRDNRKEFI